jgi:hypothetical protein
MAYDETLGERIRRAFLEAWVPFEEKRMMGGLCFLVGGKMCVGVEKDRLMIRLDAAAYDAALHRRGCIPMDFTGRPMRGFVFVTPEGLATKSDFKYWLSLALEYNPRAKSSKRNVTGCSAKQNPAPTLVRPRERRH